MSDLQATFEFSIELYKFYNVDLFQRGLYQVRVGLRVSPKVPVHIEASVTSNNGPAKSGRPGTNATLVGGLAASRAFPIMYRNEEVTLRDIMHFRAHLLVDSRNLKDSLERAEWSIGVELWCSEGSQSSGTLTPVSCRVLKLHFQPSHGLHYHLPVLFDYFHMSAVSITIHVSLVALHQPYINTPRSSKQWGKLMKNASFGATGSLENVLFGASGKSFGGSSKMAHARLVHIEICRILIGSLEGLQDALAICGSTGAQLTPEEAASDTIVEEVSQRLKDLSEGRITEVAEEEWAMGAANDIARLCAEVTLRWRSFLHHTTDRPHVHHALAARHHSLRIRRFAEGFFVLDNPRHSLAGCYDSNYQSYQSIGDAVRKSRYLALLPPLPVHCIALDGDPHIMPIIFEDRYQDTAEYARRRSVLNGKLGNKESEPFISSEPLSDDCACAVSSLTSSRRPSSEAKVQLTLPKTLLDVLEPKYNGNPKANGNIVQAILTFTPQISANGSPKRTFIKQSILEADKAIQQSLDITGRNRYIVENNRINEIHLPASEVFDPLTIQQSQQHSRYSASNLLDMKTSKILPQSSRNIIETPQKSPHFPSGISTLPARHSKSLDQLRISQGKPPISYNPHLTNGVSANPMNYFKQTTMHINDKPSTLPRSVTASSHATNITGRSGSKSEDNQRDITVFRENHQNPRNNTLYQPRPDNHVYPENYPLSLPLTYNCGFLKDPVRDPFPDSLDHFKRGNFFQIPRPVLPPRNSYPPLSEKTQTTDSKRVLTGNHVPRSNSTHAFHPNETQMDMEATRSQLRHELNYYLQKGDWSYDVNTGSLIQNYHKKSSKSSDDSGFVMTLDRSSDGTSKSNFSKTPPSTPHSTLPSVRHKKTRSKDSKLNANTKDRSKINSSRDSLSSHQSLRSRDSKSDRFTSKSDHSTPKSDRKISLSGKVTPKSGLITPKSGLTTPSKSGIATPKSSMGTPKSGRSSGKSEKRIKHKASEKMTQLMSKTESSSSNESIPFPIRRLETSASVPYSLDHGPELLRHCRSAASIFDESGIDNNFGSESLPNLAPPPPAFDFPPLNIGDQDFQILPPDVFKNKEETTTNSTSSISEQSGWVSSRRSSGPSSPDNGSHLNQNFMRQDIHEAKVETQKIKKERPKVSEKGEGEVINNFKRTVLNGDQLRERLLKLAAKVAKNNPNEKIECCDKAVCEECTICSDSICTDSQCEFNKLIQNSGIDPGCSSDTCATSYCRKCPDAVANKYQRNNSFSEGQTHCYSKAYLGTVHGTAVKKSQTVGDTFQPHVSKEPLQVPAKSSSLAKTNLKDRIQYTEKLIAAEIRSIAVDRSCISHKSQADVVSNIEKNNGRAKSEIDLAHFMADNDYEHLNLPPPKQFRDIPIPPEQFKDPSAKSPKLSRQSSKLSTPSRTPQHALQLDNPLYHVCEGIIERRKLRPLHLTNTGTTLPAPTLNKSQSTGELASRNENGNRDAKDSDLVSILGLAESERLFVKCREEFRQSVKYPGAIYSDYLPSGNLLPYFHISDEYRMFNPEGLHLIICVHGLDGNAADLRLVKTYLELGLPGSKLDFLMSEKNQGDTFSDFETMTDRLVQEIITHIQNSSEPARISFVGHSLGTIIIRSALARPQLKPFLGKLHTFLSLSGPHLGTLYNSSGLVNAGMWFMQKWKKSGSLLQLSLKDSPDPRRSFLYRLSERSQLHLFKNVLLCGSGQDRYVPLHSARLELCKSAVKDTSLLGQAYREMVHNIVSPLAARASTVSVVRYDVQHALPHTASALVGRAAHIAALDSDLFIEKFLLVSAIKYFR